MKRRELLRHLGAGLLACSVCSALRIGSARASGGGVHWGYSGDAGPDHWGQLESDYATCASGTQQSPVNIVGAVPTSIGELEIDYRVTELKILNNGHTVQVNYDTGSTLAVRGSAYQVQQFHFHTPSEHTVDGKHSAMELHIVHQDTGNNYAVLGVLMDEGAENKALRPVWSAMPFKETGEKTINGVWVNIADALPAARGYYEYEGSLTTPPCSQSVRWMVLTAPITVSTQQIATFKRAFPMNARPVQPLNSRTIFLQKA
ncbi:MAG: carbonic anhydrase family protein [Candidatus Eremiobacteraeota bacterium]|nr:carbonic anhydrase family protein [Candidatus Eremiobacteraeota bacterium]